MSVGLVGPLAAGDCGDERRRLPSGRSGPAARGRVGGRERVGRARSCAGLQVNGLAPGYILTDLTKPLAADPEFDAWVRNRTPARRWGEVADLAGPAVWLASPASDFVTGQVVYVDGGMTSVV